MTTTNQASLSLVSEQERSHQPYIGRFAPSPSGSLHFGSLVSALASYLDARAHNGRWLVRIEDIDPPREVIGSTEKILQQLHQHGLHWDGDLIYQSQRSQRYLSYIKQLGVSEHIFPCQCSRQQLTLSNGIHCQPCHSKKLNTPSALRLAVPAACHISFNDLFQGPQQQEIKEAVGDMVLIRKDGLFAYQLAVVVDDAAQNISHVIRGSDLLDSTPRQIYLQRIMALPTPEYGHIPMVINTEGQKLSKQNLAQPINGQKASSNLIAAIRWLGLALPTSLESNSCEKLLDWSVLNWRRNLVPHIKSKLSPS